MGINIDNSIYRIGLFAFVFVSVCFHHSKRESRRRKKKSGTCPADTVHSICVNEHYLKSIRPDLSAGDK